MLYINNCSLTEQNVLKCYIALKHIPFCSERHRSTDGVDEAKLNAPTASISLKAKRKAPELAGKEDDR